VPDKFYNQIDDKSIKKALDKIKLPGAWQAPLLFLALKIFISSNKISN
jgi:hypothetical protein